MLHLISVEEARQIVLSTASVQPAESVPLAEALGRTLSAPVVSDGPFPAFASSAMDGFAVRVADLVSVPVSLPITADLPAGTAPTEDVRPGTVVRIMTGAPIPDGADAIVPVEWTAPDGDAHVRIDRAPTLGQHVRPAGQDVAEGETVLRAGALVTPPAVGMLAMLGHARVSVRKAPRVAVVTTGDELVPAHTTPAYGQLRDSNGPALAAQVVSAGGEPLGPFHARDSLDALRTVLDRARTADVLVFSGGVSMGDYDLVRVALDEVGWAPRFWKVRQRPGKPLAFGTLEGKPVLGLPGNPVSSFVCFEQYARSLIAALLGRSEIQRPRLTAILDEPIRKAAGLYHIVRGVLRSAPDGRLLVRTTGPQGSNLYHSALHARAFVHLPETLVDPPIGTPVEIERLTG